jgi:D-beta-D-heptose 7-phosphate kinase/D-beta-D-heptose 1-phosphate adenosyltransferase
MNLKNLKKGKVIVFGDVILDKYIMGSIDRISPEAPVPVLRPSNEEIRLGGAANVALNLSSLGIKATLIGVTGKDGDSRVVNELLKKNKIKIALRKSLHPTISKTRLLSAQQQILRIDEEENFSEEDWKFTLELFYKHISLNDVSALVLSDYGKGTLKDTALLIKKAKAKGKIVLVDPKGKDFSKYKGADIITPNLSEFEDVVGRVGSEADLTKKGKALIKALNLNALLITRGPEGMTLLQNKKGKVLRSDFPTQARDVFDVSGAGDTVIAALAGGLAGGFDLGDSIRMANIAAGIVVAKLGTATVTPQEINPFLEKEKPYLTLEEVGPYKDDLKDSNKKIVFTNGCFDILHAGHVEYLEKAKALGDKLIVGINSDSSVSKLKGKNRPINKLIHRAKVLSSLRCVDKVVMFDENTPLKLIKTLQPDLLVKGGDYKVKDIVGYKEVTGCGGSVVTIPLVKGLSTTKILDQAQ